MADRYHVSVQMQGNKTQWVYRQIKSNWWIGPPLIAIAWVFIQSFLVSGQIGMTGDSALFYYSGQQWVQAGRVPYLYLWDIKPPLTHVTTALIAVVTGGEPVQMHAVGVALNIASVVGGITASMIAVRDLTDSRVAGSVAGLSCLAFPYLFRWTLTGFRPKYPVVCFLGIILLSGVHERWVITAAAATLAAGFWQPSAVILVVVLSTIVWYQYRGHVMPRTANRAGIAAVGSTFAVILPFVIAGAVPEMIIQTTVAPIVTGGGGGGIENVLRRTHPILAVIATVGVLGLGVRSNHLSRWWPGLFLASFGLVAISGDLDGSPDLLPLSLLIAVGVGVAIGVAKPVESRSDLFTDPRLWLLAVIAVSIWLAPPLRFPTIAGGPVYELFISETVQPQCHIRLSGPEKQMMEIVGSPRDATACWHPDWWPF